MIEFIVLIILLAPSLAQVGNQPSFLYIQRFSFFSDSVSHPSGTYSIHLNWATPQTNIINSSYALAGFQVEAPKTFLSFDAGFSNLNSVGAEFLLDITYGFEITMIQFTVILLKPSKGYIELQLISPSFHNLAYYPTILSQSIRANNQESFNVTLSKPFSTPLSDYQIGYMFSAFRGIGPDSASLYLRILQVGIISNTNYHTLRLSTLGGGHLNIYSKVSLTYIMFKFSSFNSSIAYRNNIQYFTGSTPPQNYSNVNIPSLFNPYLSQKCIIGMNFIQQKMFNTSALSFKITDTGNSTYSNFSWISKSNLDFLYFLRFCIQQCEYGYSNTSIPYSCISCDLLKLDCLTCTQTYCTSCKTNFYSSNKCVRSCPKGRFANTTTHTCESCSNSSLYQLVNGSCVCSLDGYIMVSSVCVDSVCMDYIGCITFIYESGVLVCYFCNVNLRFYLAPGGICTCESGFELVNKSCADVCGDGISFTNKCDDGNLINGDGCSESCTIEKNYFCVNGSATSSSVCVYHRYDLTLTLFKIDKSSTSNQGIFIFQLTPLLYNLNKLDLAKDTRFECGQSIFVDKISYAKGFLTVYVNFFQDLEGKQANMTLGFNNYFSQKTVSLAFSMVSNGAKLIIVKDWSQFLSFKDAVCGLSLTILALFFVSLFVHKMIGVELIHTYQVVYLVHLVNPNYTPHYSLLRWFALTVFDFLSPSNGYTNIGSISSHAEFDEANMLFSLYIIVGFSCALLIALLLSLILPYLNDSHSNSTKAINFNGVSEALYNYFFFPITMGTLMVFFLILVTRDNFKNSLFVNWLCFTQMILLSIVFYHEFKPLLLNASKYCGVSQCRSFYLPLYLAFTLLTMLALCAAYQFAGFPVQMILLGMYAVSLTAFITYHPYKSKLHNAGVIINSLTAICFLAWSTLKTRGLLSQVEDEVLALFIFLLLVAVSMLITLCRIGWLLRLRYRKAMKSKQKQPSVQQCKEQTPTKIRDVNWKGIMQQQQRHMGELAQQMLKVSNDLPTSLFVPLKSKGSITKSTKKANLRLIQKSLSKEINDTIF